MATISLGYELDEIEHAIEAAAALLDAHRWQALPREDQARRAPAAVGAVLALVQLRLQHVARALRGSVDPETIAAPHNTADAPDSESDEEDVVLAPWSRARRRRHCKAELHRVRAEIRTARERKAR